MATVVNNTRMSFWRRVREDLCYQLHQIKMHRTHYLFMLPHALVFTTFTVIPVIIAICLSFTSFNMLETPEFVGLNNYFRLFLNDEIFTKAVGNTLLFAVVTGPLGYLMSFMFAWLINELSHVPRVLFTIVFYAPSISGGMFVIWNYLFSGDSQGLVNSLLLRMNMITEPILFFQDSNFMMPLIMLIILWMSLGTTFLVFIAGFQGVDRKFYEAAAIDGINNRWQELWYITLPLLKPQLMLNAVLAITNAFGVGDIITQLAGFPSTNYAVHTIMNHLHDYGTIRYEMGYACTIATVLFVIMLGSNLLIQRLLKRVGE